jgi:FkbM family methyltransferase
MARVTITSATATGSRAARLHLALLRAIAKTGHVRKGATLIRPFFPSADRASVTFPGGGRLRIDLSDAHWSRVPAGLSYEPAVERVLSKALAQPNTYLIDCGANIGYWSSYFAATTDVVAVEPNPEVFAVLAEHAEINGFTAVQAAVWNETGEVVRFAWAPDEHEAGAMMRAGSPRGTRTASVETTTLDEIHHAHGRGRTPVVKLDVEGVEREAIEGGHGALEDGLLVYEDHGADRTHATTAWLLHRGVEIRWPHGDGSYEAIRDVARLDVLKTHRRSGYNLVAFQPESSWTQIF